MSSGFAWVATLPAMTMFAVAAVAEVLAYYVPAVDNLLDAAATPVALICGVLVSAAVMTDLPPLVKWSTAIIAGGSAAGLTQGLTTLLRAKSTVMTGGIGNSAVATAEMGGSLLVSVLALVAPFVALAVAIVLCIVAVRRVRRVLART